MIRGLLLLLSALILAGCGGDAVRSSRTWAEVDHAITPDLDSQAICDVFGCIPMTSGSATLTWTLANGRFSGQFYHSDDGQRALLLFGRFQPSTPPADDPAQPSDQELADAMAMARHWQQPEPDIRERVLRLRNSAARLPRDDRRHQERLLDAFLAELARQSGAELRLPETIVVEQPGDLDLIWVQFFAGGDDRCLAQLLSAIDDRQRSAICFPARWSLSANLRQQAPLRERVERLSPAEKRSPALRAILAITRPERSPGD